MKFVCAALFFTLANLASAQPFDLKYCTDVVGPKPAEGCTTYHPTTVDELQVMRARFVGVVKVAGHVNDTGGPYSMTLTETVTDKATGGVISNKTVLTGLKPKDAGKVSHAIYKASDDHVKSAEGK